MKKKARPSVENDGDDCAGSIYKESKEARAGWANLELTTALKAQLIPYSTMDHSLCCKLFVVEHSAAKGVGMGKAGR